MNQIKNCNGGKEKMNRPIMDRVKNMMWGTVSAAVIAAPICAFYYGADVLTKKYSFKEPCQTYSWQKNMSDNEIETWVKENHARKPWYARARLDTEMLGHKYMVAGCREYHWK